VKIRRVDRRRAPVSQADDCGHRVEHAALKGPGDTDEVNRSARFPDIENVTPHERGRVEVSQRGAVPYGAANVATDASAPVIGADGEGR
jgi:hypothetical protein